MIVFTKDYKIEKRLFKKGKKVAFKPGFEKELVEKGVAEFLTKKVKENGNNKRDELHSGGNKR